MYKENLSIWTHKAQALCLWICYVLCSFCILQMYASTAHAACNYVQTYRLNGSSLNIRPQANTQRNPVGKVQEGACLAVLQTTQGQSVKGNSTWYRVSYNGATGWISGYYARCSTCGGPPPECTAGQTRPCYTGSNLTRSRGLCKDGVQSCISGRWGSCLGSILPTPERCDNKDNDCDGQTDENNPGGGGSCNTGRPGDCGKGTQVCLNGSLICQGATPSSPEVCDGKDNNCNGQIDEGNPGGGKSCNASSSGGCGQGISQCKQGRIECISTQSKKPEVCDNQDNDCNGQIDDGLKRACYTGPPNTNGIGICSGGEQVCSAGQWGACDGELTPQNNEICGNNKDDNCNGTTDENCSGGTCKENTTRPCYNGPPGTQGKGYCKAGVQTCVGGKWAECRNERKPLPSEVCNNQTDDNCDGNVDEGCTGPQGSCEDKDKDGYGIGTACKPPFDCDDNDPNINPKASEICGNGKDDDCTGGELPCGKLRIGEAGCQKPSECETDFCVLLGKVKRCSEPCKLNSDCPIGFECLQKTACWPIQTGNPGNAKRCSVDKQCPSGAFCDRGFCSTIKSGCSTGSTPNGSNYVLYAFLLMGILIGRWKRRKRH